MKKKLRITALDISDRKIAGVVAELESKGKISVLGHDVIHESCLKNGLVMDIAGTANVVKNFVKKVIIWIVYQSRKRNASKSFKMSFNKVF